jgi:hypothetical protein
VFNETSGIVSALRYFKVKRPLAWMTSNGQMNASTSPCHGLEPSTLLELPTLIAIAALESQQGGLADARARLDEVWDAAARGLYLLYQTDADNILADIERAAGNTQAAIEAATRAYRAAWCDGPPYTYHWGLEKAKAHLTALNAPEPEMPAFDASAFEPLPEVEINPQDEHWVDPAALD